MSMAPQELENSASKYASDAIKADSQGAKGMAIANYQNAIDVLVKITKSVSYTHLTLPTILLV